MTKFSLEIIPVTRRVNGYTRIVEMYATGRRTVSDHLKYQDPDQD